MDEILEIKHSNKKQIGFILLGLLLMTLGSLHFLDVNFFKAGYSYIFILVGLGLAVSIYFNMKKQDGKAAMIFNEDHLIYNPEKNLFVEWNDIESYSEYNLSGTRYVLIHLKDIEGFISKQRDLKFQEKMKRALNTFNTPVVLNTQFLEISTEKLKEEIHKRLYKVANS